jgi:hypothetical protein
MLLGAVLLYHFSRNDEPVLFFGYAAFNLYALLALAIPFRRWEPWAWCGSPTKQKLFAKDQIREVDDESNQFANGHGLVRACQHRCRDRQLRSPDDVLYAGRAVGPIERCLQCNLGAWLAPAGRLVFPAQPAKQFDFERCNRRDWHRSNAGLRCAPVLSGGGVGLLLSAIGFILGGEQHPLAAAGYLVGFIAGIGWTAWLARFLLAGQLVVFQ